MKQTRSWVLGILMLAFAAVLMDSCQQPVPEMLQPDTSQSETQQPDASQPDTPDPDTPGADTPEPDTPGADTPGADTPGSDTPGSDTPGADTPTEPDTPHEMVIQASFAAPVGTRTSYVYTEGGVLKGTWDAEEAMTVVSFGRNGITAVDRFVSTGEAGREQAAFLGTWTGNEGDKVICLYPDMDSYAGTSIFDGVREGSPTIYMRNLSRASSPLQHDDPSSVSDVDLMLGEVTVSDGVAHVSMEHQFAVFRIEVTLMNLPYEAPAGSPYDQARVNSIRIKSVDPDAEGEDEWGSNGDPVFVKMSGLDVTSESYTGKPFAIEKGPLDYYLLDSGHNSPLCLDGVDKVEKTFFVPVRFDKDIEAGVELCFQFGGNYYDDEEERRVSVDVFPGCDVRRSMTSAFPLKNGKVYSFQVTI